MTEVAERTGVKARCCDDDGENAFADDKHAAATASSNSKVLNLFMICLRIERAHAALRLCTKEKLLLHVVVAMRGSIATLFFSRFCVFVLWVPRFHAEHTSHVTARSSAARGARQKVLDMGQ